MSHWTRQELVTMAMALEEFRTEYGPGRRDLAERVNAVLRGPGDCFVLVPLEELEDAERVPAEQAILAARGQSERRAI